MPDFLLFLGNGRETEYYQVFIESKGEYLITNDDSKWKANFLTEIANRFGIEFKLESENKKYKLTGLPLFNKNELSDFENKYYKLLDIKE